MTLFRVQVVIIILCAVFAANNYCYADYKKGEESFVNGRHSLQAGNFESAVSYLSKALGEFPVLEDYTLLYLSEAYHKLGQHKKSLEALQKLIKKHLMSPLRQKARAAEIREAQEIREDSLLRLFKSYANDYPEDEEMRFIYGLFLRENGAFRRSSAVLKKLYMDAGPLSERALSLLKPDEPDSADLIVRASNLMAQYEFKKAEHDLRWALEIDDGSHRKKLLKALGDSLFRQKKYTRAAAIYSRIDDTYSKARSLYRAGDHEGFNSALRQLLSAGDKNTGILLLADAADNRRAKDYGRALGTYRIVIKKFPVLAEKALWGIGWTYYISGKYNKASQTFSRLSRKYSKPEYLYWRARSIESGGGDASGIYSELMQKGDNLYSFISYEKNGNHFGGSIPVSATQSGIKAYELKKFERVEVLESLDMTKEAADELLFISKHIRSRTERVYTVSKFQKLGYFQHAIKFAEGMSYSEEIHQFWYPLAYWETVRRTSRRYRLDPFIALSVMREESRFDPDARSAAGALGLMQIMPQTAFILDKNLKIGIMNEKQICDARNNIHLGIYYLKSLFNEFHSVPFVLAAYNAGERAVRKWQARGKYRSYDEFIEDIPYPETRKYVKKVLTSYFQYRKFVFPDKEKSSQIRR